MNEKVQKIWAQQRLSCLLKYNLEIKIKVNFNLIKYSLKI